jgi:hypothetical protein
MATEHTSIITAPPGGIWTDDVGVITGSLEIRTICDDDGEMWVMVRYEGADEWYTVRGATGQLHDPADAEAVHQVLAGVLNRPED